MSKTYAGVFYSEYDPETTDYKDAVFVADIKANTAKEAHAIGKKRSSKQYGSVFEQRLLPIIKEILR